MTAKKGSRFMPSNFTITDDLRAWAAEHCPGLDVDYETDKIRDHEFRFPRRDWDRVWRNWMRTAYERQPKMGGLMENARTRSNIVGGRRAAARMQNKMKGTPRGIQRGQ